MNRRSLLRLIPASLLGALGIKAAKPALASPGTNWTPWIDASPDTVLDIQYNPAKGCLVVARRTTYAILHEHDSIVTPVPPSVFSGEA